jgi:hypothetical protein
MRLRFLTCALLAMTATAASAAQETFSVTERPCPLFDNTPAFRDSTGKSLVDVDSGKITAANLAVLLPAIAGLRGPGSTTQCDRAQTSHPSVSGTALEATIVHVVKWTRDLKGADSQEWYVYHSTIPGKSLMSQDEIVKDPRLYGRRQLRLVYIYLYDRNPPPSPPDIRYTFTATKKTPQPISDLFSLLGVAFARSDEPAGQARRLGFFLEKRLDITLVPSNITVEAKVGPSRMTDEGGGDDAPVQPRVSLGSKAFVNESKYHVGFSVAFPLNSYEDISLESFESGLMPVKTKRQNVYAVVNLYLWPVDLTRPQQTPLPYVLLGVPIKSEPWRNTMIALGMNMKWVAPFAGVVINIQPPTADRPDGRTVVKGIFGINVPVGSAKKLVGG